jgi:hypothetical protein
MTGALPRKSSPPALIAIRCPGATTVAFDMAHPAGRTGAKHMLQRLSRPNPARFEKRPTCAAEPGNHLLALRRAQTRIGLKLLSGEEWASEIAAERIAMASETVAAGAGARG